MEVQNQSGVAALDMISKLCSTCTTMPMLGVWKEFKIQEITQVCRNNSNQIWISMNFHFISGL